MRALALCAALSLAACATVTQNVEPVSGIAPEGTAIGIGQSVQVGEAVVTPLQVTDDSRCPSTVQCVWQGRVAVQARVETRASREIVEIATNEPADIDGYQIGMEVVEPVRRTPSQEFGADEYRFRFAPRPLSD